MVGYVPGCVSALVHTAIMANDHLSELLKKYEAGTCTDEEKQAIEKWYAFYDKAGSQQADSSLDEQQFQAIYTSMVNRLKQEGEWPSEKRTPFIKRAATRWAAAAAILIMAGTIYFLKAPTRNNDTAILVSRTTQFKNDIAPGGNKAVLTLADGSQVVLDSLQNGNIAKQGNVEIVKPGAGQLLYKADDQIGTEIHYNTLTTPRGGQYEIVLPDGSKAWLNASSSLRFPTVFTGKERIVELTGEAYFEVAPSLIHGTFKRPFVVKNANTTVQVLGTHFNVNGYQNEAAVKVTLLEGSVNVLRTNEPSASALLTPGQQAALASGNSDIDVKQVDIEEAIAWKNSLFWFHDADIKTVMRQLERWYDVEVIYTGSIPKKFNGSIPMNMSAMKVFHVLEMTGGVHFRIDGRKVFVLP